MDSSPLEEIAHRLARALEGVRSLSLSPYSASQLFGAVETRRAPESYRWDGLRRGHDPRRPAILWQYTLAGWGAFQHKSRQWQVTPGQFFLARLPSAHRYWLPDEASKWSFAWMIVDHPFAVDRLGALIERAGPVHALAAGSSPLALLGDLFENNGRPNAGDDYANESAFLQFVLELEREVDAGIYPRRDRERLLAQVRAEVVRAPRALGVTQLAEARGMTRSNFSHYFRTRTGLTPSEYILRVRLDQVMARLRGTDLTLKEIATATGFADANHLCKCFRRRFHSSPGQFRGPGRGRKRRAAG